MSPESSIPPSERSSVPPPVRKLRQLGLGTHRLVNVACYASLVSMVLMAWSVLDPTPFPVMVSMSVGQAIGTLALGAYLAAVLVSQWRSERKSTPPSASAAKPSSTQRAGE